MHHICWQGLDNKTIEDCRVEKMISGYTIQSFLNGNADEKDVDVSYVIKLNNNWQVLSFSIDGKIAGDYFSAVMQNDNGKWTDASGKPFPEFDGMCFIDITLTPFTNTLPVNSLGLTVGESAEIDLIYIDVVERKIYTDHQKYTRISDFRYKFENDGGNFTAEIEFDRNGFVMHYPNLFSRQ